MSSSPDSQSQLSGSKLKNASAADAAAAASLKAPPKPLPLPPGVRFDQLRSRLKPVAATWEGEGNSVGSRVDSLNEKIRFAPRAAVNSVKVTGKTWRKPVEHNSGPLEGRSSSDKAGSAREPPTHDEATANAVPKLKIAGGDDAGAPQTLDSRQSEESDTRCGESDHEGPTASVTRCGESEHEGVHPQSAAPESQPAAAVTSPFEGQGAAAVTSPFDAQEAEPFNKASLLEICRMSPEQKSSPLDISDDALVDKIMQLLPEIDTFTNECDELFAEWTAESGSRSIWPQELYDLTQRLIDMFGSRDPGTLDRISLIYSAIEQNCGPDCGVEVVQFRGYVASVLTQILHELESRMQGGDLLPDSGLQRTQQSHSSEPARQDESWSWLPGRLDAGDKPETGGGTFDMFQHALASARGRVAALVGFDAREDPSSVKQPLGNVDELAAVESCVARGTVETAQDM